MPCLAVGGLVVSCIKSQGALCGICNLSPAPEPRYWQCRRWNRPRLVRSRWGISAVISATSETMAIVLGPFAPCCFDIGGRGAAGTSNRPGRVTSKRWCRAPISVISKPTLVLVFVTLLGHPYNKIGAIFIHPRHLLGCIQWAGHVLPSSLPRNGQIQGRVLGLH